MLDKVGLAIAALCIVEHLFLLNDNPKLVVSHDLDHVVVVGLNGVESALVLLSVLVLQLADVVILVHFLPLFSVRGLQARVV